jgi:hypothetical protein
MRILRDAEFVNAGGAFVPDDLAAELDSRRRKRRYAYLAWLCLGSHYLYLDRRFTQALFWLTGGGLLLWWIADLFRLPELVARHNRKAVGELLNHWQLTFERRIPEPAPVAPWRADLNAPSTVAASFGGQPMTDPAGESLSSTSEARRLRPAAAFVLVAALVTAVGVHAFAPRPMYPPASSGPSFSTVRQVNVREAPSTSSPIRAVIARDVILTGHTEEIAGKRPSLWLRISRGPQSGGYVALQNLEKR